jgi:26S proteasome regulatory subunit N1
MMSAAASLGLSLLWDTDVGLSHVDKYTYSSEEHIKAGALFATGLLNTGVRTEVDAALALLGDYVDNKSIPLKTSAIMGWGLPMPVLTVKIFFLCCFSTWQMIAYQWR